MFSTLERHLRTSDRRNTVMPTRYASTPCLDVLDSVTQTVRGIKVGSFSRQGYETRHAALHGAGRHASSDADEVCVFSAP